jgi:hypothetical protein
LKHGVEMPAAGRSPAAIDNLLAPDATCPRNRLETLGADLALTSQAGTVFPRAIRPSAWGEPLPIRQALREPVEIAIFVPFSMAGSAGA